MRVCISISKSGGANCFPSITSATPGGILDRAIDAEEAQHGDFLRLVSAIAITFDLLCLTLCSSFTTAHSFQY